MTFSSCLIDNETPLVLDTSVLINLRASTHGSRILDALPHDIIVPKEVANELEKAPGQMRDDLNFLRKLVNNGNVQIAIMSEEEFYFFTTLVSSPFSLDDGESATIAIAQNRNMQPVLDERKGRAKAARTMPRRTPGWTLDLLLHPSVLAQLGDADAVEALYLALRVGQMRIAEEHCDDVVALIGINRAKECTSLPNYKRRFKEWSGAK